MKKLHFIFDADSINQGEYNMLQIIDLENKELFTQVFAEESATVIGGGVQAFGVAGILAIATGVLMNPVAQAGLLLIALNPDADKLFSIK
jgi:hypothetical protein